MEIFKPIRPDFKKCIEVGGFSSMAVAANITVQLNDILLAERGLEKETVRGNF